MPMPGDGLAARSVLVAEEDGMTMVLPTSWNSLRILSGRRGARFFLTRWLACTAGDSVAG